MAIQIVDLPITWCQSGRYHGGILWHVEQVNEMQSSRWICRWDKTYNSPCECGDAHPPVLDVNEEQNNQGIRVVVHSHALRDPYCICIIQIDHMCFILI